MKKLLLTGLTAMLTFAASAQSYWNPDLSASSLDALQFTAADSNGDGNTWYPTTTSYNFTTTSGTKVPRTPICINNAENDDWLFTPGIQFESGKTYKVRVEGCKFIYAAAENTVSIMLGNKKTAAAMTTTLLAAEDFLFPQAPGNTVWAYTFEISVPTTGDYFIGFHALGKPGQKVGIASIDIAQGIGTVTPAAVENLVLTPAADGVKKLTISFTAPTKAKDGSELTAIRKIEIRRGSDLVKVIDNPAPGSSQSYEDIVAVSGEYTYTVQAFSEAGAGDPVSATTFVGVNVPTKAVNVQSANTGNISAKITWEAPTLDKDGYPMSASLLSYDVYRAPLYSSESTLVAEDITELFFDDSIDAESATEQQFYVYTVVAKTTSGNAAGVAAPVVPMGTPYQMPYLESFPGGQSSYIFSSAALIGNNYWSRSKNFDDVFSIDNDNGMLYLNGQIGGASTFYSGLIDLGNTPSSTLNFYAYNIVPADPLDNELQVTVVATDGTVKSFDKYAPAFGWTKTIYRLDEFEGKTIRLIFTGYRNNSTELHLDAIAVSTVFRNDVKLNLIDVPAEIRSGEPFDVKVDVVNAGTETTGVYSVELYCNGVKVDEQTGDKLVAGAFHKVIFTRTHTILDAEKATYSAKLVYAADENPEDNASETVEVKLRKNSYPVVTDLSGATQGSNVTLTWSEPDTEKAQPYDITDDFESYPAWANSNLGDWILVDLDKALIGGFSNADGFVEMPGIETYSQQSWWIFDSMHENFNNGSFATSSGHQFLASMYSGTKSEGVVTCDDWAISPELYGGPQTISIQARSYSLEESHFEDVEILYSTGSVEPSDFVSVAKYLNIPHDFGAYTADLPDGAKRFAIRNNNYNRFMLMVDDVNYIPVGDPAAFSINGYNVYRDGVQLNDTPVEECEYIDSNTDGAEHTYYVTVLYSAGESQLSNAFKNDVSGIENVTTDTDSRVEYYNLQGMQVNTLKAGQPYIMRRGNVVKKIYVK